MYASGDNLDGIRDFYKNFLAIAKDSSYVVYSGHAGFLEDIDQAHFLQNHELKLDSENYQIFVMNSCQSNTYTHPFYASKDSKNLDLFLNARMTVINSNATTSLLNAISLWARTDQWISYPELVRQMAGKNSEGESSMIGIVGEQDNPTKPY